MYENAVDLDTILTKANQDYRHVPMRAPSGTEFLLRNALQLDEATRKRLTESQEEFTAEGADQQVVIQNVLRVVADNPDALDELFDAIGDNVAAKVSVFKLYNERTQAGEA